MNLTKEQIEQLNREGYCYYIAPMEKDTTAKNNSKSMGRGNKNNK